VGRSRKNGAMEVILPGSGEILSGQGGDLGVFRADWKRAALRLEGA